MAEYKKGDKGEAVKEIQRLLNAAGARDDDGNKLEVDGDFGPLTDKAVRWFQAQANIVVDGIVGPVTMGELKTATEPTPPEDKTWAQKLVAKAREYHSQNVVERPLGSNKGAAENGRASKYSVNAIQKPWFPNAGMQWCAMTVATWLREIGFKDAKGEPDWPPLVSSFRSWARKKGWLKAASSCNPQPGDIFLMGDSHIGIVERYDGFDEIITLEGNCNNRIASITRPAVGSITHYIRLPRD